MADADGKTPLQHALKNGRVDNLQLLLLSGNNVPPTLLEDKDLPASWRDLIVHILEKRDKAEGSTEKEYLHYSPTFFPFDFVQLCYCSSRFQQTPKKGNRILGFEKSDYGFACRCSPFFVRNGRTF